MGLKAVNIRIDEDLLESIDKAAKASGQDRSNWIRAACAAALPGSSSDAELLDEVKVVTHERERSSRTSSLRFGLEVTASEKTLLSQALGRICRTSLSARLMKRSTFSSSAC